MKVECARKHEAVFFFSWLMPAAEQIGAAVVCN